MTLRSRLIVALMVLTAGYAGQTLLAHVIHRSEAARPDRLTRPLAEMPRTIAGWVGVDETPRAEVLDMMKLDDYLQRVYRHPSGQEVVLWVSFSRTSRDQYHYPTVCMAGHGWEEDESQRSVRSAIVQEDPETTPQLRLRFTRPPTERQDVYYWYYLIGESAIDETMRRLSRQARLFLRGRHNASVTVEIFTKSARIDGPLVDEFADHVARELAQLMPPGTVAECELGAGM